MSAGIDLNADIGEGFGVWRLGDDEGMLEVITSANIACGFHAGDPSIMRRLCAAAAQGQVVIGAQVGYRDLAGFGRRAMDVASEDLGADIVYQIGALDGLARLAGQRVRYVKPHGALYNTAAVDARQAAAVAQAVADCDGGLALLGLPDSALSDAAARFSVRFVAEAFADRAYTRAGRLVPRSEPNALITDPVAVAAQARSIVLAQAVVSVDGVAVSVHAQSVCLHGDTPGATELARAVRDALGAAGIAIAPFG
jgi:5-oxoprolinase (ATP-hydrolysing) subunit A